MKPCQNCQRRLKSTVGPLCRTCYRKTAIRQKRCRANNRTLTPVSYENRYTEAA